MAESPFVLIEESGVRAVEGPPGAPLMLHPADVSRVVEACLSHDVDAALLHAPNLTPAFFDLSSREAGEVLQKLRNYRIRLAVGCPLGDTIFSRRFGEVLIEERRQRFFGVFDTRGEALEWLAEGFPMGEGSLRAEAVTLANDVLARRASAIVAARRLLHIFRCLHVGEDDPDRKCFVGVESETDGLPVGVVRAEWDGARLRQMAPDIGPRGSLGARRER